MMMEDVLWDNTGDEGALPRKRLIAAFNTTKRSRRISENPCWWQCVKCGPCGCIWDSPRYMQAQVQAVHCNAMLNPPAPCTCKQHLKPSAVGCEGGVQGGWHTEVVNPGGRVQTCWQTSCWQAAPHQFTVSPRPIRILIISGAKI
eukprot:40299-Pelagomonas_calceolata.AAC.5